jgi:hypothetical protein
MVSDQIVSEATKRLGVSKQCKADTRPSSDGNKENPCNLRGTGHRRWNKNLAQYVLTKANLIVFSRVSE